MDTSHAKRAIGGRIAKANGRDFESLIIRSAMAQGVEIIRIHDGARRVGERRLIPVAQPFDFAGVLPYGRAMFFDAKNCGEAKASFSAADYASSTSQLRELIRMERGGAIAGFMVNVERLKDVLFIHASDAGGRIRWDDPRWVRMTVNGVIDFWKLDTRRAA